MKDVLHKTDNILIASPFFFPELISTAKYNTFLAKKLLERGCNVVVICSHPFYPAWRVECTKENLNGLLTLRGGKHVIYPGSMILRRLVLEIWYARHFLKESRRLNSGSDTVVAIVPPIFFTLFVTTCFKKSRKIAVVHDLIGIMAKTTNSPPRRLVAGIMKKVESFLLRRFETVVCLSEGMKKTLVSQYDLNPDKCKIHYPFVTIERREKKGSSLKKLFPDRFKHIVYSGALGEKQKPLALYQFFVDICEYREDLCCHIFSGGPIFEALRKDCRHKRIFFHDFVPEEQLPALYAYSDLQVIPQAEDTGDGAFPSKLPNLIAAGVPILAICDSDSELSKMIEKVGCGKSVNGWEKQRLFSVMDILLCESKNKSHTEKWNEADKHIHKFFNVNRLIDLIIQS